MSFAFKWNHGLSYFSYLLSRKLVFCIFLSVLSGPCWQSNILDHKGNPIKWNSVTFKECLSSLNYIFLGLLNGSVKKKYNFIITRYNWLNNNKSDDDDNSNNNNTAFNWDVLGKRIQITHSNWGFPYVLYLCFVPVDPHSY